MCEHFPNKLMKFYGIFKVLLQFIIPDFQNRKWTILNENYYEDFTIH